MELGKEKVPGQGSVMAGFLNSRESSSILHSAPGKEEPSLGTRTVMPSVLED